MFVRLEKGSFVTFRIFVSALIIIHGIALMSISLATNAQGDNYSPKFLKLKLKLSKYLVFVTKLSLN